MWQPLIRTLLRNSYRVEVSRLLGFWASSFALKRNPYDCMQSPFPGFPRIPFEKLTHSKCPNFLELGWVEGFQAGFGGARLSESLIAGPKIVPSGER